MTAPPSALELRPPARRSLVMAWGGSTLVVLAVACLTYGLNPQMVLAGLGVLIAAAGPIGSALALRACRREVAAKGLDRAGVLGVHAYVGIRTGAITALLTVTAAIAFGAVQGGVGVGVLALLYLFCAMAGVMIGGLLGGLIAILAGVPASYLAFRPST